MKSGLLWMVFCASLLFAACGNKTSYKKTAGGMPYKLYRSSDTQKVHAGEYVKLWVTQKINDSVTLAANHGIPVYVFVDNQRNQPYDVSELWTSLHIGDSLVTVQMMDTFIKRAPQNIPPQFKKGDRVITLIKVLATFSSDSLARADELKTRMAYLQTEIKQIEKYLAEKHITAEKSPSGAFVQIIRQGTGNVIDSGKWVTMNYTGTSWSGKRFDSNTDTSFHHAQPYSFLSGSQQLIKGFDEAVLMLQKGSVAKVYIPSVIGYGPSTDRPGIKPFEHLIFDVEIVDVQDKKPEAPQPKKVDTPQ
jgi:FKBP-type peptidyl-prolyl cis-trans isomerase